MKYKTCSSYMLLKDGKPIHKYQTEWFKYSESFSMSKRDLFSFMCGICVILGNGYSFDNCETYPNAHVTITEV